MTTEAEGLSEELETFLQVALSDMELPSYKRGKPRSMRDISVLYARRWIAQFPRRWNETN